MSKKLFTILFCPFGKQKTREAEASLNKSDRGDI
jgi:hypothetical protein